jgi:hypothetical protein
MAKPAQDVAEEIQELLRKNGKDVVTLPWPDFYKLAGRERMKDEFTSTLATRLRELGLLVAYGQSVVLVAKDFRFAVVKP